jgi:superfamily II DNA or RNA helicase
LFFDALFVPLSPKTFFRMSEELASSFLAHFHKSVYTKTRQQDGSQKAVYFALCFEDAQPASARKAYLTVVDSKGEPITADYHYYEGAVFNVLRSLSSIRQEKAQHISWGNEDSHIYLADYPYLLHELETCDNVVDKAMNRIGFSEQTGTLALELSPAEHDQLKASVKVMLDGKPVDCKLLTENYILNQNTIHPIRPVGDNWLSLGFFEITFPEKWVAQYLSVFYSFIDNADLIYPDHELMRDETPQETQPTLYIEKVDKDKALYIRLVETIPSMDFDLMDRFDLVYSAQITMNHQVVLRRIKRQGLKSTLQSFLQEVERWAPDTRSKKEIFTDGELVIIPKETAANFLINELPRLISDFRIVGTEKLIDYKVKPVHPRLNLKLGSGIDFLEGTASITLDNEEFSLKKFLQQYSKNRYIELANGNKALVDPSYMKRLQSLFKKVDQQGHLKVSFFDIPDVEELLEKRMEGEAFKLHRSIFEGFNTISSRKTRMPKVNAKLRNYQKEGVKWIDYLYENNLGGCLADDMGLGKTLQALTMLARIYPRVTVPTLVVMPKSLVFNWENEIRKFTPQLSFYVYYGQQRDMAEAKKANVILTTYAMVRNDIETLMKETFHYVILDESQNIKNVASQTSRAICLLNAKHRLALSGTPIENNLTEIYSLFRFINPAMFWSLADFNEKYTIPIQRDNDQRSMQLLRKKIHPFILRRLKKDVLKELPNCTEQTLYVDMSEEQRKFYEERRLYYLNLVHSTLNKQGIEKSQFVMFQAMSELRRIASVPESMTENQIASQKIEILTDNLLDAVGNGHKVVVFFNFIAGIEIFGNRLEELGIDYAAMTGSTNDRQGVVNRFQNEAKCMVLLMTLKTGGVGLNLTVADTVFIFEPWWNVAAEEQAIDRLHRLGQKHKVNSYKMIVRGTIEEKIQELQAKKSALVKGIIGSDASLTKMLTEEDIDFILGEGASDEGF